MAGLFADFPHNHPGLYGLDINRLTDGRWAALEGSVGSGTFLKTDPDTANAPGGIVLCTGGSTGIQLVRYAMPNTHVTAGIKLRLWADSLPATAWGDRAPGIIFRNTFNLPIMYFCVLPDGSVGASPDGTTLNQVGASSPSVILPHSWNDIEIKLFQDATAGTLEVKVNNVTKLSVTGLALLSSNGSTLGSHPNAIIALGSLNGSLSNTNPTWKCVVIWDGSGSNNNDFLGNVFVAGHDLVSDAALHWTPSYGSNGSHLIGGGVPTNALNVTGVIITGERVNIGTVFYQWTSGSVDAGTPAGTSSNPWLVALGVNAAASIQNMAEAINASGTPGTTYSTSLTAHPVVDMTGYSAGGLGVHATDGVSTPACTESMANGAWARTELDPGTVNDFAWVEADNSPPAASTFNLSDLPPDVTSVRWIETITRGAKVDGGDGNVQTSVSPDGTNWADGTDRPYTVAQTFYDDVSELSPVTGLLWTPTEVNSVIIKLNRTA